MAALAAVVRADEQRMNVMFITADNLGLQLGCYGETLVATPNLDRLALDRLAAGSTQFDVAYVAQASCSPSRSSMFTGLHTHSTGQFGLTNGGFALHSELRDRTIPNLLHKAGYRTGIIGKLRVAPEESFQFDVRQTDSGKTREVRWVARTIQHNGTFRRKWTACRKIRCGRVRKPCSRFSKSTRPASACAPPDITTPLNDSTMASACCWR